MTTNSTLASVTLAISCLCTCQYFAHPEGGGHTPGFRQKTIPDRREFDKLMESGSQVIDFGQFLYPGLDAPSRLKGRD